MIDYATDSIDSMEAERAFYGKPKHFCSVCEREIHAGESCYCFDGEAVCEDCCTAFVMDRFWYASPNDIDEN